MGIEMNKKPVLLIALGGNALIQKGQAGTIEEQFENLKVPVRQIANLSTHYRIIISFGTSKQKMLTTVTEKQLSGDLADNQFAEGSMLPKAQAAVQFIEQGGKRAVITSIRSIAEAINGKAGTIIIPCPPGQG